MIIVELVQSTNPNTFQNTSTSISAFHTVGKREAQERQDKQSHPAMWEGYVMSILNRMRFMEILSMEIDLSTDSLI